MINFMHSHKLIWVFLTIGLFAIVIIVLAALLTKQQNQTASNNGAIPQQVQIVKKDIDPKQLPDKFPVDFPQEQGAAVLTNDVQTAADGRLQATRSYVTAKSLDDNIKLYQSYFQSHGWTITATVSQSTFKSISATKGDLNVQVGVNDNQVTKQKTVDVYVVQKVETK